LAVLALAAGEENATLELNRTAFRYPGVPMTDDVCECLNWKSLYDAERIWCGEGLEFYSLANSTRGLRKDQVTPLILAPRLLGYHHYTFTCKRLFGNMDDNRCVNFGSFAWDPDDAFSTDQWCYVPFSCKSLNGGGRLKRRPVSWKRCVKGGKDRRLRDLTPPEMLDWAAKMGAFFPAVVSGFFRLAYPSLEPELWKDVKYKWRNKQFDKLPPMLLSAMKHKVPIIIEQASTLEAMMTPKKIVHNGTLWALICDNAQANRETCLQVEQEFEMSEL